MDKKRVLAPALRRTHRCGSAALAVLPALSIDAILFAIPVNNIFELEISSRMLTLLQQYCCARRLAICTLHTFLAGCLRTPAVHPTGGFCGPPVPARAMGRALGFASTVDMAMRQSWNSEMSFIMAWSDFSIAL